MIVTDRFVFLHLHKSGGTFVNQLLLSCVPSARRIGYHLPYRRLPADLRHLPVIGTVRNPWAYYVSWYHFQKAQPKPNALFLIASDNDSLDFAATIGNLLILHDNPAMISSLGEAFPDQFVGHGLNVTKACIAAIAGSGKGFYSFLHDRMYEGAVSPTVVRAETLRQDFRRFVSHPLAHRFLDAAPDMNTSRHGHYHDYYDITLRDAVGRAEAELIARYAYSF